MKTQVRNGVFETNSSSTHSLCIYKNSDWERFKKGEMVIESGASNPELVELTDEIKSQVFDPSNEHDKPYDYDYITYDVWNNIDEYSDYWWETIERDLDDHHIVSYYAPGY